MNRADKTDDWLGRNERVWDERVRHGRAHTRTVRREDLENPMPHIDPLGWLGGCVAGQSVLCLASGGGLQSILFAKAGADVTVLDISSAMLKQDIEVARELGLRIRTVHKSMDDLQIFPDRHFDVVVQPVSTCYVPDLVKVYRGVARIMKPGGLYIVQHKQPGSLQGSAQPLHNGQYYVIENPYYRSGPLPPVQGNFEHRESGAQEFLHRWEVMIGGLCREGFVIEDLMEPRHADSSAPSGTFRHRSQFLAPYVLIKARRSQTVEPDRPLIIT